MDPILIVATTSTSSVVIPSVGLRVNGNSIGDTSAGGLNSRELGEGLGDGLGDSLPREGLFGGEGLSSFGNGFSLFDGGGGFFGNLSAWFGNIFGGFIDVLSWLWSFYAILAYLFSILLLVLYVYAAMQKKQYEELRVQAVLDNDALYAEQYRGVKTNKLDGVLTHIESENPSDWKLAIVEADIILDNTLIDLGHKGGSLGERLRGLTTNQLPSLNDAWEAHKVRNRIAHDGSDFILTHGLARETIVRYQRVLGELGVT